MKTLVKILFFLVLLLQVSFAQWVQTNGPSVPYVPALAVSGTNLFAGTNTVAGSGGVFLSTDNGTSWITVNTGLTDTNVCALAISHPNLFAGTNGGVFLSTNNGNNWTNVNPSLCARAFAVSGSNVFAGTDGGFFLSTNNGTSWTAAGLSSMNVFALAVSGTNLFAGVLDGGVFFTTNSGTSWVAVNSGLTDISVQSLAVIGTNLFAGTQGGRVFLTTNNGASWTCMLEQLWSIWCFTVIGTNLFAGTSGWFGGGAGIFLTTNHGATWTAVNSGLINHTDLSVRSLVVSGLNLFAGTSGSGVWRRPLTEMITDVEPMTSELPHQFSLHQNYSNPFNPSTKISWQSPVGSWQTLKVFDVLGNEVATLVEEYKPAGRFEVEFNPASGNRNLASGIYFYQLKVGGFIDTKKMLLLR